MLLVSICLGENPDNTEKSQVGKLDFDGCVNGIHDDAVLCRACSQYLNNTQYSSVTSQASPLTDMAAAAPTPFKISIPQDALDAVKKQLANATLPPPPPQSDDPWQYGVPNTELERLIEHWTSTYDWRRHEAALNADLPQFTLPVAVQDHGIFKAHFVHQRSKRAGRAIPFLFVHGWPGHFAEVRKIMPLLTNPASDDEDAFHVVAPSLPGFGGFSSAPEKAGFSLSQYAEVRSVLVEEGQYY